MKRIILAAREAPMERGSPYLESEHLLLGILREDPTLHAVLWEKHSGVEAIRTAIDARTFRGVPISGDVVIPLSRESKRILNRSSEEAEKRLHKHITGAHILLGILAEEESLAAAVLAAYGVTRLEVMALLSA